MSPETVERSPAPILIPGIFTGAYLLISAIAAVLRGNIEFLLYVGVMLILIGAVWVVHRRVSLVSGTLWCLSVWGLLHMLGGLVTVPPSWPTNGDSGVLDAGYRHLGVLDVSATAIDITRLRLGDRAQSVEWFVSSVTEFVSPHPWDLWHDRAVLHFLTEEDDRAEYRRRLESSMAEDGAVVLSTFGPEGPTRCSGLDVRRYSLEDMTSVVGFDFSLEHHEMVDHTTPRGGAQQFLFCLFRRTSGAP
jgi:hypothetical protein